MMNNVPLIRQPNSWSCGPTCIKMLADYYCIKNPKTGKSYSVKHLERVTDTDKEYGTQFRGMRKGFKEVGLKLVKMSYIQVRQSLAPLITIVPDLDVPREEDHYVIITGMPYYDYVNINDPYHGSYIFNYNSFYEHVNTAGNWLWAVVPVDSVLGSVCRFSHGR